MNALWTVTAASLLVLAGCARADPERVQREPIAAPMPVPVPVTISASAAPQRAASSAQKSALGVADCNRICEAASKLNCKKSATCVNSCLGMVASAGECSEQLRAFFKCLGTQSADHWECLEDGTGAIREGFCEGEQAAFAACLDKNQH